MNETELKQLTEEQLIELVLDIDLEYSTRISETQRARNRRGRTASERSLVRLSHRELRELGTAANAEATRRGISILLSGPGSEQIRQMTFDGMITDAHRGVAQVSSTTRLAEGFDHNLQSRLIEPEVAPPAEVLVSFGGNSDKPAQAESKSSRSSNKQEKPLTERERRILEVILGGTKGRAYGRELDNAKIAPPRKGIWKEGPRKYEVAYVSGQPWRHWIQDEKSKIRRRAELATRK